MQLGEKPETWLPRVRALKDRVGNGNGHGMPLTIAAQIGPTWRLAQGNSCPCRCHTLTSSPAASPAKTSATPAKAPGSTGHARVFGTSTPDSFASYDPATSSWRTSQLSLLEEWSEFSETWPRSGMTRNGTAYRLQPLAPLTGGTGSGSLPTPTAKANMLAPSMQKWAAHRNLWPTPTARDWKDTGDLTRVPENSLLPRVVDRVERESWATPTAWLGRRPAHAEGNAERWHNPERSNELSDQLAASGTTGSLNPTWVEWLMGFPTGWTDLEASGTPSSRRSRSGSAGESSSTKP
jgi:hypothetical protein